MKWPLNSSNGLSHISNIIDSRDEKQNHRYHIFGRVTTKHLQPAYTIGTIVIPKVKLAKTTPI